ncbi:MAG: hypothetical protein KDM81_10245 [Verrucomicrobiae bacterium]|nr:hypothetical protein [Verrucomicrobiae bacterium]MCP5520028.1 hypothetical protein [Verrucomicrobiales bacterium]
MAKANTTGWDFERATGSVARAFLLSVLLHALGFGVGETGSRLGWWDSSPLAWLGRLLDVPAAVYSREARLQELEQLREERERTLPVMFVDVDPSQASPDTPPDTPYYSAVSSQAANPDPQRDTADPKLEGEQDRVLKTADSERASAAQPLQTAPEEPAPQDLQPPPEPAPESPSPREFEPAPAMEPAPEPDSPPEVAADPPSEPEPAPGDLAMAQPRPVLSTQMTPGLPHRQTPEPRPRPRTLAEAYARLGLNPDSAMVGRKLKQDGGVKRFSIESSLAVQASPLGDYDRVFVAAVQECWYQLLNEQRYSLDRVGRVILKFRLTREGRITNLTVEDSDVGEIYTTICQYALTKPSPYAEWPPDLVRLVGADYRDIRFTFYY